MLRRHFMTKVGYKPNIIIVKYHADKKIHLFNDDNVNKIEQEIAVRLPNGLDYKKVNTVLVNNNFDYGIGYWKIYLQICEVDNINSSEYGKKLIGLFCVTINSNFYENDEYITFINMNINTLEDEDVYFVCGSYRSVNLNKLILPSNLLYFMFMNPFDNTNLQKIIIPPNVSINSSDVRFINKNKKDIELIFTSNEIPKFAYHKYDVVKCPANLIDKYKEYYPNATTADNILILEAVNDNFIVNFPSNRNIDNELYIGSYIDDTTNRKIFNIICYDDLTELCDLIFNYDNLYITNVIIPKTITKLTYKNYLNKNLSKFTILDNVTHIDSDTFRNCIFAEGNLINNSSVEGYPWGAIIFDGTEENGILIPSENENSQTTTIYIKPFASGTIIIPSYLNYVSVYSTSFNIFNKISINLHNNVNGFNLDPEFIRVLDKITIDEENPYFHNPDNSNSIINNKGTLYALGENGYIHESVIRIKECAICKSFESFTIPETVKKLDRNSIIIYCKNLYFNPELETCNDPIIVYISDDYNCENLYIGAKVNYMSNKYINFRLFKNIIIDENNNNFKNINGNIVTSDLKTLLYLRNNNVILNGIEEIEDYILHYTINYKDIIIPKSVLKIYNNAFNTNNSSNIIKLIYEGTIEEWNNIEFINGTTLSHVNKIICTDGEIKL